MPQTKIYPLLTGEVRIDRALAHQTKLWYHPLPATGWFRGAQHKYWAPVPAHLVDTGDALVLVDTGWHEILRESPVRALNRLALSMYQGRQQAGQELPAQLARLGYAIDDITHVVMTHLHSDHAAGLPYLVGSRAPVYLGPGEWREANRSPFFIQHMFRLPLAYRDVEYQPMTSVPGFDRGFDLLGDGRIVLLPTPGHTRGHQSVLVRAEREVLLTADIAYDREALVQGILPGSLTAPAKARASLARVRAFTQGRPEAIVQYGHDPVTWAATSREILALNGEQRARPAA
ncbi:MAG: N-acyl homoserine lactonase family protein [Deinococcales bacterium]